jgi:hypothetical protein
MSATEVIVIHAFFSDGSCGTANSKPYRPGTKDTLHIDKPVPARDSLTAWYTENGMLYFVEKASPEKVMYRVKYKFKEGALYFINENASVISLKRRALIRPTVFLGNSSIIHRDSKNLTGFFSLDEYL